MKSPTLPCHLGLSANTPRLLTFSLLLTMFTRAATFVSSVADRPSSLPAKLISLSSVRLLDSPFADARQGQPRLSAGA